MKKLRLLNFAGFFSFLLMFGTAEAVELVTYQYSGNCFNGSGGNCAFYDLSEGDPISGYMTLDGTQLSSTAFTEFLPTDANLDFSFTFGNFSVGKIDLDLDLPIRVMLFDDTGTSLIFQNAVSACLNAVLPCNVVQTGSQVLSIGTSFGSATTYVDPVARQVAYTTGVWQIAPVDIPTPTIIWLFGSGLLILNTIVKVQKIASSDANKKRAA